MITFPSTLSRPHWIFTPKFPSPHRQLSPRRLLNTTLDLWVSLYSIPIGTSEVLWSHLLIKMHDQMTISLAENRVQSCKYPGLFERLKGSTHALHPTKISQAPWSKSPFLEQGDREKTSACACRGSRSVGQSWCPLLTIKSDVPILGTWQNPMIHCDYPERDRTKSHSS